MAEKKTVLWVIGDSTLSSFQDKYYYPRYGYGTKLSEYLDSEIEVVNIALSGRSSKSYTTEPQYQQLLQGMKQGDYLLIGFGHNDEKTEEARFTAADGDYQTKGSFAESLYRNYIQPAKEAGCQVILCTPIVRRSKTGVWEQQELHITQPAGAFPGGDYPKAIRKLGAALSLPVVDMTEITRKLYEQMGPEQTLYLHAWPSNKAVSVDNTHTNIWGARVNACNVLREMKRIGVAGLAEHIVDTDLTDALNREKYLVSNPEYKPVVYTAELGKSSLWEDAAGFSGTVFGDIMEAPSKEHFTLEPCGENAVHIAVRNSVGKIAAVSDGIAMYYKKIPVGKNFVLRAKAVIHDYFSNDQVSFGLMVRDDMYIDKTSADILGDYVAAAPLMLTHGAQCWNCFARKSGVLTQGGLCTKAYKPGDEVELQIESTTDGYACTFGKEQTITGGFDFQLTSIDAENVYAGMFVARNADITFQDIELIIK